MTFRAPLITPVRGAASQAAWVPFEQNLLGTSLAIVPATLMSFTNEKVYARSSTPALSAYQPPNLVAGLFGLVNTAVPLNLFAETLVIKPNPQAALQPIHVNLANTLLSTAITDRFSSTYWGHQYSPLTRQQPQDPINLTLLGIPVGATPFSALDFPNPTRRKPTIFSDSFGSTNLLAGIPKGATPFASLDFPNPTRRKPTVFADLQGSTTLLNGIPSGKPFIAMDFPNPIRSASRPPDTSNISFSISVLPPPPLVGRMSDWGQIVLRPASRAVYFEGSNAILPLPSPPPVLSGQPGHFGDRVILPAKKLGETVFLAIDFISKLGPGETILTATCTCVVYTGNDPSPSAVISGAAAISGTIVDQLVTGGVLGTIYEILAKATTSLGQTLELSGFLAVIPDLP